MLCITLFTLIKNMFIFTYSELASQTKVKTRSSTTVTLLLFPQHFYQKTANAIHLLSSWIIEYSSS